MLHFRVAWIYKIGKQEKNRMPFISLRGKHWNITVKAPRKRWCHRQLLLAPQQRSASHVTMFLQKIKCSFCGLQGPHSTLWAWVLEKYTFLKSKWLLDETSYIVHTNMDSASKVWSTLEMPHAALIDYAAVKNIYIHSLYKYICIWYVDVRICLLFCM